MTASTMGAVRSVRLWRPLQAGPLPAADELDGNLAAGLVDHLVAEHDRAHQVALGGLLVGVEDGIGPVELLLSGREHLVEDTDLVGVQGPLAVVAEDAGALAVVAEGIGVA